MAVRRRQILIGTAVALVCLALTLLVVRAVERAALAEGHARAETTLRLTVNALDGQLQRYEALPELLADQAEIRALVTLPRDPARLMAMNHWLQHTAAVVQASDLYILDLTGTTIAASNHDRPDSFIGQNFAYRPYFYDAVAGGKGRFFALGTTSGVRGYYFASPIRDAAGAVTGVVALKIGVEAIEAGWGGGDYRIALSDPEGIIFMATDPAWRYAALLPLTPDRLARTKASRRYADAVLVELDHQRSERAGHALITLTGADGLRHEYLEASQMMEQAGWTVHVLLDTGSLRAQARVAIAAFVLLLGIALALAVLVAQRRARLAERLAMQVHAQAELERQVQERTAELRRTQADLVQAGKLAALGQMSAALSHEINQPLAAARNYADSAALLIDRGDSASARENIGHILSLIDRMAAIARHLRNVARKPNEPLKSLSLPTVVADALQIADTRLQTAGAQVSVALPEDLPQVQGGAVRLQQVLVNVLTNAADAMADTPDQRIEITAAVTGGRVALQIRDHGPGVPAAIAERIFDPFFSTKRVGSGLGLGLSISYNIMKDFGGDLQVTAHPQGGAVFTLMLQAAEAADLAAE